MPKQTAAGLLLAVGLVIVASQLFRSDPNVGVFWGGILLAVLGGVGFSDAKAARR